MNVFPGISHVFSLFFRAHFLDVFRNLLNICNGALSPYKGTTCISCWKDVETVVYTSFQRRIHVVFLGRNLS